ncbi:MAG: outer membrane beta-barrel protein [Bacteroidia bacterium]|nr:outer membrane beta-barrel protein [Bacteroidia bacterium]
MKKIVLTLVAVFFTISLSYADFYLDILKKPGRGGRHSQRNWSTAFVGISVGAGVPLSSYVKADTIEGAGYAKIGVHFNLSAGVKLMPYIGVMALAGGTINGFNTSAYAKQDTSKYAPSYSAKPYYLGQYLAGPFVYFTDGETYDITIKTLAGLTMVTFPLITATSSSPGWNQVQTKERPNSKSFGYCVGVGVNFRLTDRIGMMVNLDYFGTNVKYSNEKTTTNVDFFLTGIKASSTSNNPKTNTQSIGILNVSAGVALLF